MERETDGGLGEALSALRNVQVPAELARATDGMLTSVDEADMPRRLEELEEGLRTLIAAVVDARERIEALVRGRARAPFGEAWWERRERAVGTPDATADWLNAYVEAILAGRYDVALRLAAPTEGWAPPGMADDALAGAQALADGTLAGALGILRTILDGPWAVTRNAGEHVDVEILLARALLRTAEGATEARDRLRAALDDVDRLGQAALQSRLSAVLGECALSIGDETAAEAAFVEALHLVENEPAALVGMGMLAERQENWSRAEEFYDRAVGVFADPAALGHLHPPATGNLYWRLSRRLSRQMGKTEQALQALDRALALGMTSDEPYPERRAYVDKGYLLERLGRAQDAAQAFADGADRYGWRGKLETARALLERAVDLDPGEAAYRWSLLDVLRQLAYRPESYPDLALIGTGLHHWREGLSIRRPSREEGWAYVAYALAKRDDLEKDRSEQHRLWEAVAATELAVLLDDSLVEAWRLMSSLYGELGYAHSALDAAERVLAADPADDIAAYYRSRALLGLGRVAEASEALPAGDEQWLRVQRAFLYLVQEQPQQALAALDMAGEPEPVERLVRAFCLVGTSEDEEAAEELETFSGGTEPVARPDLHEAAWTAYVRRQYDRAEELLRRAMDSDPAEPADELIDHGQVLLARGAAGDMVTGEQHLAKGVSACSRWDTLRLLETVELPFLLRRVAREEHAADVADVVGRIQPLIAERMQNILRSGANARTEMQDVLAAAPPGRAVEAVAVRAALARAVADSDPEAALEHYLALAASRAEGWEGVVLVATRMRDDLDSAMPAPGEIREGVPGYVPLLRAVEAVPPRASAFVDAQPLRRGLAVRAAVNALVSGHDQEAAEMLVSETPPGEGPDREIITAAVAALVRDGSAYWALTDRVATWGEGTGTSASLCSWAEPLLGATSLDAVHRTRREDMDMTAITPLESPIVVSLGSGLVVEDPGPDWVLFRELIPQMRKRIQERTGVTIPGIRFRRDEHSANGYRICWERQEVRRAVVASLPTSGDDESGLTDVITELEVLLLGNLERLFGPDDLDLWRRKVDPGRQVEQHPRAIRLVENSESRLQTHRILRMLLREGFPLVDGVRVLEVLGGITAGGSVAALDAATRVRAALPQHVPGADGEQRRLPEDLQRLVAAGLRNTGTDTVWQVPWSEAARIVSAVRAWQGAQRTERNVGGSTIVVTDPRVRTVLWRLLASGGRRTAVVSEQEAAAVADPAR